MIYPRHPMFLMHGMRGDTMLANGTANAVARVPRGLARLRLLNASNARVYDFSFSDGRSFHWIGSDAGLLETPVQRRSLWLAPGQRAELLVDFSDGRTVALRTGADPIFGMGMMGGSGGVDAFARRSVFILKGRRRGSASRIVLLLASVSIPQRPRGGGSSS